ncbi:MAG: FAD-dependent oxidoreductase [Woeseiaceae bacterium]|nr:FAD-dependent oxidoreductase [Woeseiaceae bacterium]NIP21918.1 FAD-dependent oxidoreductase [Woeseiaceae bacterium]NIS91003.1 FAD-dependent oxidoreductase [Woeseiaceae bacterium]
MADKLNITRRDFLNGVALGVAAGSSLSPLDLFAQGARAPSHYPPALTGMRGSEPGSFEIAHAVALSGARYPEPAQQTDATYDLVVVGGGISGLAAAFFYQQRSGGGKRVLIVDNHDDFGGHARRNEFNVDGTRLISYGGSQSLEAPSLYSRQAKQLLEDVGIDIERFYDFYDRSWAKKRGLHDGIYFSREAYGADQTLESAVWMFGRGPDYSRIEQAVSRYPIADTSKRALVQLMSSDEDLLTELGRDEKIGLLRRTSYSDFLRKYAGMPEEVVLLLRDTVRGYWGIGWDALSALEAWRLEQPGTRGLGIEMGGDGGVYASDEPYIFHFPDGNAGVARALVRSLLPHAVPGRSMEDLATDWVDYAVLDEAGTNTRIRLSSTAVDVRHTPDQSYVDVTYVRAGEPERVRGKHVVLACYNQTIPHICAEMPETQVEALTYATKTPLAYINVAVRNWRPFAELNIHNIYVPQPILMHSFGLDFPVSMGDYRFTQDPEEPTVIHGSFAGVAPDQGLSNREQNLVGRQKILEMTFDDFESQALRQFDGALGKAGFDAARDITAMTVNRWPHGYAYEYNELFDPPEYLDGGGPHIAGRQRIGRISIANSDSQAYAYVDGAIDAAWRAVGEQLSL